MRKGIDKQMKLGEVDISQMTFSTKSRDEIPQLLRGLQYTYCNVELREEVLCLMGQHIKPGKTGRPGMDLWKILVLGTIRLNCNWNYDRLKEMADNHLQIREMMGHVPWLDRSEYPMQTLKDNVALLTPELLTAINIIVVKAGHNLVKKNAGDLQVKCDSFVVETNVHFPTDINLLYDATRKCVQLAASLCSDCNVPGWRQSNSLLNKFRSQLRFCGKLKHSSSKIPEKQKKKDEEIKDAHRAYLESAERLIDRASSSVAIALIKAPDNLMAISMASVIDRFIADARHQIDLIERRVLKGEVIPHDEKVFSIFEKHTEWICKGKAGTPQELGLRVGLIEDQYGFILTHQVMEKIVDSDVAFDLLSEAKEYYPNLYSCSFDKGFWSIDNLEELQKIVPVVALPKKGKLSQADRERQHSEDFQRARKGHAAVESCINALENHGLDRCPDRGLKNFKRYVSLAVLARNLQKLGALLQKQECARLKRSQKIKAGLARKREMPQAA